MQIMKPRRYPTLRAWRVQNGLSQPAAALKLGCSLSSYVRYETRRRFLRGPDAKRVQARTHVPIEVLVGAA